MTTTITSVPAAPFPLLYVLRILDERTLVIAGDVRLREIVEGEALLVLAIGPTIEELGGRRLIVPKATVSVKQNGGSYIIAGTEGETEELEEAPGPTLFMKTRIRRTKAAPRLNVREKDLIGNPATRPIQIGDLVVRSSEYVFFVEFFGSGAEITVPLSQQAEGKP
jgi:hypothetical protein